MAGHFMARGEINCVVVGADRIAANGDTANKIGTYTVAVLAANTASRSTWRRRSRTLDLTLSDGRRSPSKSAPRRR